MRRRMLTWLEYKESFRKHTPNASRVVIRKYYTDYLKTEQAMLSIQNMQCEDFLLTDECKSLAPIECKTVPNSKLEWYSKKKKEENPMNYASAGVAVSVDNPEKDQRRYMVRRIEDIYYEKKDALRSQFNIDATLPQSPQELADMIKNGEFTIKGLGEEKKGRYFYWTDAIEFRKAPADKDGFDAAKAALKKFKQEQIDIVTIKSLDDGFNALKAMEAWTA